MARANGPCLLTPRHREVLQLIIEGMTNRQIAKTLCISHRTVEVHRTNIYRRLGARNISDLFREAILQQLVPTPFSETPDQRRSIKPSRTTRPSAMASS